MRIEHIIIILLLFLVIRLWLENHHLTNEIKKREEMIERYMNFMAMSPNPLRLLQIHREEVVK
jgi:hypothetical protein